MLVGSITKLPPKFRRVYGGCGGCRNRHIRCDRALPGCAQCAKRKVECPGYDKQYEFVEGPSVRARSRKLRQREADRAIVDQTAIPVSKIGDRRKRLDDEQAGTSTDPLGSVSLSTFNQKLSEQCLQTYFLSHYFDCMADIISIIPGPTNPFSNNLKQYITRSQALKFAIISMSALHMENSNMNKDGMSYAWHYRMVALNTLQKDVHQQAYSVEMLTTVLILGTTECWFDTRNSGSVHLPAASQLVLHMVNSGMKIPLFLTNFLCWFETLASFVSDTEGLLVSSPATYAILTKNLETVQGDHEIDVDPVVGIWGSLIPLVGQVGTIVRQLRRGTRIQALEKLIDRVESDLLEWELFSPLGIDMHNHQYLPSADSAQDFFNIAEAYRLSTLLTLYNYNPHLLEKRGRLLIDIKTPSEFLSQLACSTIALLQRIPIDSKLWRLCSIPILSAGQLIIDPYDRDFLRSMIDMMTQEIRVSIVGEVGKLLEDVWRRRDAGFEVWWMDILDETGTAMLIN